MATPRPPIVGDDSGEDSASVEWCRLVQAREKSRPRDRRGRIEPGEVNLEPYVCDGSSFGERGARLEEEAGPGTFGRLRDRL